MKALIVAGAATLAGVAGVVGLSTAMDDGSATTAMTSQPVVTAVADPGAGTLDDRIARVRRAELAADAALVRARAGATPVTAPGASSVPLQRRGDGTIDDTQGGAHASYLDDDHGRDDDHWDDHGRDDDHGGWEDDHDDDHGDDD